MNNLESNFKTLRDTDPPATLHQRIMEGVNWTKIFPWFLAVVLIVVVATVITGWRAIDAAIEADLPTLLRFAWEDFELSWSFVADFTSIIWSSLPRLELVAFLGLLGCGFGLYRFYRRRGSPPIFWRK